MKLVRSRETPWTVAVMMLFGVSLGASAQSTGVDTSFAKLKNEFQNKSASGFSAEANDTWALPSVYVTKKFVARSTSALVKAAAIRADVVLSPKSFEAKPAEVKTEQIDPIACEERGCPGSCDVWDADCHLRKLDCERLKAMEKAGCELKKLAQQSISGKKLLTVFLYDYDTGASDTVSITGTASARISALDVSEDLTKANLVSSVSGTAKIKAKVRIQFESALKAALLLYFLNPGCLLDYDTYLNDVPVAVDEPALTIPIAISKPTIVDGALTFNISFAKTTVLLRFQSHPVARLFASDVRNLLHLLPQACPLPLRLVSVVEEFFPNDFMKKEQELPEIANSQTIAAVEIPVKDDTFVVSPISTLLAFGAKAERKEK